MKWREARLDWEQAEHKWREADLERDEARRKWDAADLKWDEACISRRMVVMIVNEK